MTNIAGRKIIRPTGVERQFDADKIIVSKTNTKGIITYANDVFLQISGYTLDEVIGKPHNLIRHPNMPKCIFKLLWQRLKDDKEIFAYVDNLAKNGDNYWVFAHVTPTHNNSGEVIGYHSSRRVPDAKALHTIQTIYPELLAEEQRHSNPKDGVDASTNMLNKILEAKKVNYDEFIFSL